MTVALKRLTPEHAFSVISAMLHAALKPWGVAPEAIEPTNIDYYRQAKHPTGLHVTLPNGHTVSIQWHSSAYSSLGRGRSLDSEPTVEMFAWDWAHRYIDCCHQVDDTGFGPQPLAWASVEDAIKEACRIATYAFPGWNADHDFAVAEFCRLGETLGTARSPMEVAS